MVYADAKAELDNDSYEYPETLLLQVTLSTPQPGQSKFNLRVDEQSLN